MNAHNSIDISTHRLSTDDGHEIAWDFHRHEQGDATIVLVHGLGEHRGRYDGVVNWLGNSGVSTIRYDQRGHGDSSGPRGHASSFERVVDDLEALLDSTKKHREGGPTFLYGHSFGGAVVLSYLMQRTHDMQGAIVTSPLLRPVNPPNALVYQVGKLAAKIWPTLTFSIGVRVEQLTHDQEMIDAYRNDTKCHRRVSARLGLHMLEAGDWLMENASKLRDTVLLYHGEQDHVTSFDASREFADAASATCEFVGWANQFHELHHERGREEVLESMSAWLDRQLNRRASA